ncbi:MAG: DUF3422 family protein, partial [Methylococcales bacterium]|nr:DUF3422 family protein [Methylococcales bacterium]
LRAKMQLRMQQMVEGISMVAITYYAASLIGKIAEALHALGCVVLCCVVLCCVGTLIQRSLKVYRFPLF